MNLNLKWKTLLHWKLLSCLWINHSTLKISLWVILVLKFWFFLTSLMIKYYIDIFEGVHIKSRIVTGYKCTLIFKNFFIFLNWRIIALQNCVVFCQTSTWISHRYIHAPSLELPSHLSPPSHPSRLIQSPCLSSLSHTENSHWLYILYMVM